MGLAGSVAGCGVAAGGGRWDAVPDELKRQARWVCWRLVEKAGRRTKMPVCAATGKMASSTDASTWCSFEDAVAGVGRVGGSGVGFVFGPDRAYTGLDLDHVLHDGVLEERYRWVVDAAGTYTEVSPSGDGLHLYFRGSKPEGAERCRKGPVEMYDHDRFFTVTGTPYTGVRSVACRPGVVEQAYRTWIEPPAAGGQLGLAEAVGVNVAVAAGVAGDDGACAEKYARNDNTYEMTDEELLAKMVSSRNGAEIRALLDGDLSAHGGDHSAADMALCNKLAFWCAGGAGTDGDNRCHGSSGAAGRDGADRAARAEGRYGRDRGNRTAGRDGTARPEGGHWGHRAAGACWQGWRDPRPY